MKYIISGMVMIWCAGVVGMESKKELNKLHKTQSLNRDYSSGFSPSALRKIPSLGSIPAPKTETNRIVRKTSPSDEAPHKEMMVLDKFKRNNKN